MRSKWDKYEDDPDRRWYGLAAWKKTRRAHLDQHPLCVFCTANGKATPANVVDHIKEWRKKVGKAARWAAFFDVNNLQSLCKLCHDSTKQIIEKGRKPEIGFDGWPVEKED